MIKLSKADINYLIQNLDLAEDQKKTMIRIRDASGKIQDDLADELRDLCSDSLDVHGFDEKYRPTSMGKKLEELIDKLFVG